MILRTVLSISVRRICRYITNVVLNSICSRLELSFTSCFHQIYSQFTRSHNLFLSKWRIMRLFLSIVCYFIAAFSFAKLIIIYFFTKYKLLEKLFAMQFILQLPRSHNPYIFFKMPNNLTISFDSDKMFYPSCVFC